MNAIMFFMLIALQVADLITTLLAMRRPGAYEANPLMASVFSVTGVLPGLLIVKGAVISLLVVAAPYLSGFVLVPLLALYVWVIVNNLGVLNK